MGNVTGCDCSANGRNLTGDGGVELLTILSPAPDITKELGCPRTGDCCVVSYSVSLQKGLTSWLPLTSAVPGANQVVEKESYVFVVDTGEAVPALDSIVKTMRVGEKRRFRVNSKYAFGSSMAPMTPRGPPVSRSLSTGLIHQSSIQRMFSNSKDSNKWFVFDVELISFGPVADLSDGRRELVKRCLNKVTGTVYPADEDDCVIHYRAFASDKGCGVLASMDDWRLTIGQNNDHLKALDTILKSMVPKQVVRFTLHAGVPQYWENEIDMSMSPEVRVLREEGKDVEIELMLLTIYPFRPLPHFKTVRKKIVKKSESRIFPVDRAKVQVRFTAVSKDGSTFDSDDRYRKANHEVLEFKLGEGISRMLPVELVQGIHSMPEGQQSIFVFAPSGSFIARRANGGNGLDLNGSASPSRGTYASNPGSGSGSFVIRSADEVTYTVELLSVVNPIKCKRCEDWFHAEDNAPLACCFHPEWKTVRDNRQSWPVTVEVVNKRVCAKCGSDSVSEGCQAGYHEPETNTYC
eukprot:GILJ01003896.1.p1 GENE.GILJ01003896.1~~GILJ01003896.1.p1  ORF type:complete len:521 (-),score=64.17 GILJ01003896.1:153-1715(-)